MNIIEIKERVRAIITEAGIPVSEEAVDEASADIENFILHKGQPPEEVFARFTRFCKVFKDEADGKRPDGRSSGIVPPPLAWDSGEPCPVCKESNGVVHHKRHSRENGVILETSRPYCMKCYQERHDECVADFEAYWDRTWESCLRKCEENYKRYGIYGNCWDSYQMRPSTYFSGRPPAYLLAECREKGIKPPEPAPDEDWGRHDEMRYHVGIRIPKDGEGKVIRRKKWPEGEPKVYIVKAMKNDQGEYDFSDREVCVWPFTEDHPYDFYFLRSVCFAQSDEEVKRLIQERLDAL